MDGEDLALTVSLLGTEGKAEGAAGLAAVDGLLGEAASAAGPRDRAKRLEETARRAEKVLKGLLEGKSRKLRRTCVDRMRVREGGKLLWNADLVEGVFDLGGRTFTLTGTRLRSPSDDSTLSFSVNNFFGTGTYPMAFATGLYREFSFIRFGIIESGSLEVTEFNAVSGRAKGTFTITARGCLFNCATFEVTGGEFELRAMKTL